VTSSSISDADLLQRVRELREAGRSPKEIARALGVRPSVAAQLVREVARPAVEAAPEPAVVRDGLPLFVQGPMTTRAR
jgi:orotate phosphoribosyltransferase-like protein